MNIVWAIKRVRAMGIGEFTYRLYRVSSQIVEATILACGWRPHLRDGSGEGYSLFEGDTNDLAVKWHGHFDVDTGKLDKLVDGYLTLLSHDNVAIGGSVDWLKEPVSGTRSPTGYGKWINYRSRSEVGDIKLLWELGRQQYLIPVAVGYMMTGDSRYRKLIKEHINSWIELCPFGYTIHWCSSLEVSLRIISWSVVNSLLLLSGERRGLYSLIDENLLRNAIFQHAWFIRHYLSLHSSANNHLIGELTGLWAVCSAFDLGREGQKWATYASDHLEIEASKQVYSDGVDKEQAVYYHYWVLEYLLFGYLIGKRVNYEFTDQFSLNMSRMAKFLSAVSPNNGLPPQIGDADDGFVTRFSVSGREEPFHEIISICNVILDKYKNKDLTEKVFWYSLMAGIDIDACQEQSTVPHKKYPVVFPEGGYAILGDENVHIIFDAGPLGYTAIAAHGHADALSVCLAIDGEWWLVDPGTYTYHDNVEWRNYFRSTMAHNTVLVDGIDQSKIGGDFLWLDHANAELLDHGDDGQRQWVYGTHDGYQHLDVRHYRRVEYSGKDRNILVTDTFNGTGKHQLCWHWHLSPKVSIERDEGVGGWVLSHSESDKKIIVRGGDRDNWSLISGSSDPILGWYSDTLGYKLPTSVIKYQAGKILPYESTCTFTLL